MGNYNTQYQSYYNNLTKKQRGTNSFVSGGTNKQGKIMNFYIKRLTRELIGVLALFIILLFFKVVSTPKTQVVYNYSKQVVNTKYDYSIFLDKAKGFKINDVPTITTNFLEKIKSTISNGDALTDKNIGF